MRADFYHLTRAPAEQVLPTIAEKLLETGARLVIVSGDSDQLDRVDRTLWEFKPTSFLPHGKMVGEGAADQPILLSETTEAANAAKNVALADGVWRDEALAFDRAFYLFGPDVIEQARAAWRTLGDQESVERHYWKQDEDGKWREGP